MKKIVFASLLCLLTVFMAGCNVDAAYDDDSLIVKQSDTYARSNSNSSTGDDGLTMTATMSGTETVWEYDAETAMDVKVFSILSVTEGGRAKLVLIQPDDEVIILEENTDNSVYTDYLEQTVSLKPGNCRIKIVCAESPKFELKLSVRSVE